jgi:hypothetical protein
VLFKPGDTCTRTHSFAAGEKDNKAFQQWEQSRERRRRRGRPFLAEDEKNNRRQLFEGGGGGRAQEALIWHVAPTQISHLSASSAAANDLGPPALSVASLIRGALMDNTAFAFLKLRLHHSENLANNNNSLPECSLQEAF